MQGEHNRRKCPRIPVYLDVRIGLKDGTTVIGKVINLSTEGICVKTDDPVFAGEEITAEFLLPDILNSVRLDGEVVWYRYDTKAVDKKEQVHFSGVQFLNLVESYRSLIRYVTLKIIHDVELVREQGSDKVISDVLNLPPKERETALKILTHNGFITEEQKTELNQAN